MNKIQYFQEGGGMPQDPAMQGAPQGGADPTAQLQQMVQQWVQSQDPQLAQQIVGMLAQAMGLMGGQGAPAQAPQGGAPAYAKGGTLPKSKSAVEKLKEARGL